MSEEVTVMNFEEKVLKADKPVLVDFFATWCNPCRMMAPTVEEIEKELAGEAYVYKVDIDENPDIASQYGVMSIPTFIVFEGGKPKAQTVGAQPKEQLLAMIAK